jgi:hypothetical protein
MLTLVNLVYILDELSRSVSLAAIEESMRTMTHSLYSIECHGLSYDLCLDEILLGDIESTTEGRLQSAP